MSKHRTLLEGLPDIASVQAASLHLLGSTLDLLPVNVVITDPDARIIHANRAAGALLAAGDPIWSRHGQLAASHPAAATALKDAIAAACNGSMTSRSANTEVALGCRDGRVTVAHVRPLLALQASIAASPSAVLFITEPRRVSPPLDALARFFELSPAETRVLELIVSGNNRKEAAASLGLADSTIKTHLKNLYGKTGTSDQPGLRRLVTSLSWPGECLKGRSWDCH